MRHLPPIGGNSHSCPSPPSQRGTIITVHHHRTATALLHHQLPAVVLLLLLPAATSLCRSCQWLVVASSAHSIVATGFCHLSPTVAWSLMRSLPATSLQLPPALALCRSCCWLVLASASTKVVFIRLLLYIVQSSAATMFAPWSATGHCCCMMATKDDDGVTVHIIWVAAIMPLWRFTN